ncbi:virulence-associated E family protein [Prevotella sp. E15-22]|uniref:virulence-associated E family protein n=1 Tax=Prevotella sp. E15-22 TaxID=2937774 RepID=UPI00204968F5|nr:virulence-associated E family protein [Prevotella sp. E15-22]UPS45542.1 virulence-associated E family protein [Prevotella sp. E15-22]
MNKIERKQLAATVSNNHSYNRLDQIKEWLNENYIVRVNLLDRSKVSLSPTPECSFHYEYAVTENDILLHAFADEIKVSDKQLRMLLSSPNHMESFNPICDYLESLRGKYKGPSQIDLLCTSLRLVQDDKENKDRANQILRKWLVATAACALGIHQNDVALGLVGEKAGIGKTTFFELLVPPCLKEYYQVAQKDERLFSMPISFTQRFLLNFDEFAAISKRNEEDFKLYMSASVIEIKRPGSRYAEKVPRVASCCFTSNKNQRMGGFISKPDNGLMRRLAVIEVDAIDDYRKRLDVDQLWAEAIMLIDGGFDPVWSQKEYQEFVVENRQYVEESNALRLLRLYYKLPEAGEKGVFRTARMIVEELKDKRKLSSQAQQVNEVTVGQALVTMGFKPVSQRTDDGKPRYGYFVVPSYDTAITQEK